MTTFHLDPPPRNEECFDPAQLPDRVVSKRAHADCSGKDQKRPEDVTAGSAPVKDIEVFA